MLLRFVALLVVVVRRGRLSGCCRGAVRPRRGQLSLGWGYVGGGVAFGRFANRPYIRTRGIRAGMRGSRLHGNDGGGHPHPSLLPSREKGPEPSRGAAEAPHTGASAQGAGMRGSRLHGNDGGGHPHPSLLPSREKGPDIHTRRQGCEVPVFTGTTEGGTLTLALSQRERGFSRLHGNDGGLALILFFCP